jgi:hypothetical protein
VGRERAALLASVPGVGKITVATLSPAMRN